MFTGHEFGDGLEPILRTLRAHNTKASFFFTGDFYRNPAFTPFIRQLKREGHYLGAHSDKHLLYCDWSNRDSLLVTRRQFEADLRSNYRVMRQRFGLAAKDAPYFLPPYEWYNDSIAAWTINLGFQLINFTPGTRSHADYTYPGLSNYVSSDSILASILQYERSRPAGLNGFILLLHAGVDPRRPDPFYKAALPRLLLFLQEKGYQLLTVEQLLLSASTQ
ncbi:MAG TPA: polysaccharide deacetylase family protein [Lacibacter sp.]|nr:polysaccharide deacetylase family protein [Lacibacter sp.]HMO88443.1 polysaccharide deacetylase family protein [Lacibacter sp.]HMP87574.1 polysaccharide deacetylase family protein [Lacibacter sp.]